MYFLNEVFAWGSSFWFVRKHLTCTFNQFSFTGHRTSNTVHLVIQWEGSTGLFHKTPDSTVWVILDFSRWDHKTGWNTGSLFPFEERWFVQAVWTTYTCVKCFQGSYTEEKYVVLKLLFIASYKQYKEQFYLFLEPALHIAEDNCCMYPQIWSSHSFQLKFVDRNKLLSQMMCTVQHQRHIAVQHYHQTSCWHQQRTKNRCSLPAVQKWCFAEPCSTANISFHVSKNRRTMLTKAMVFSCGDGNFFNLVDPIQIHLPPGSFMKIRNCTPISTKPICTKKTIYREVGMSPLVNCRNLRSSPTHGYIGWQDL